MKKLLVLLVGLSLLASCGSPVKILKDEIKKSGHLMYQNPIAHAGPGTLIGGSPKQMMYVASPQTCFSDSDELPVKLRQTTSIALPDIAKTINVSGNLNAELVNLLGAGQSPIGIGTNFKRVKQISLSFEDVSLEYLDAIAVKYYYDNVMDQTCKDFLDQVGFIVQAIKVGKMKFEFTGSSGGKIALSTPVLEEILKLGLGTEFSIENKYSLIIKTPKYLGYQLGQLRKKDNGFVFYRAVKEKKNRWVFESINVFSGGKSFASNLKYSSGYRRRISEASIVKNSIYK